MRKIGKDDIRRMVIEEVASAKREVAARKSGTLSRERLREIILEEVAHHQRSRPLQESHDMRITPKLSLARALLGEADDKGAKTLSFADGGPGKLKVGSKTYHVYHGDPMTEDYLPQFHIKVATKVVVKPDAFAAYFSPIQPAQPYKVDFTPGVYDPGGDMDPNQPGTIAELMKQLADGVAMQYVPLTSDASLVTLIAPEQLARFRKQKGEPKEEAGGE